MKTHSAEEFDFILAGGGLAGLSLAWHLAHSPLADRRILILDKEQKKRNDHTWCYWSHTSGPFDSIAHRTWDSIFFAHPQRKWEIDLAPYQYRMIRAADFYETVQQELARRGNIILRNTEVQSITEESASVHVKSGDGDFEGRWLFNSLFRPGEFQPDPKKYLFLKQHFLGWEIETTGNEFAPDRMTLFDFRTPQKGAMRFFYILPLSARRALVEYTLFSERVLTDEEYQQGLREYISGVLGIDRYTVQDSEQGVIPMTNQPLPRRLGKRILAIGTRGGRVKPSTGYAFQRIQKDSAAIVASLLARGDPFHLPPDRLRHHLFDAAMLRVMRTEPDDMADIFLRIFSRNPVSRVFRFLDEEISTAELPLFLSSLPILRFTRAFLGGM